MRNVCRFFLEGKCKFGSKCKYDHVRYTSLVDPPQWIYSSYRGLDMMEISPEEVRFAMMCGDTKEVLDNFWIKNYTVLCDEMDLLEKDARIESVTNRYVDLRKHPDVFMAPFDTDRVLNTIYQMREQRGNVFQDRRHVPQGGYGREGRSGGQSFEREYKTQHYKPGGSQSNRLYDRQEHGGWNKDSSYDRKDSRKPKKEEEHGQGTWNHSRDGNSRGFKPEEEFDIEDGSSSLKHNPWGGRPNNDVRNRRFDGRQDKARKEEADFIEEDFEYGKVPYAYRKSNL